MNRKCTHVNNISHAHTHKPLQGLFDQLFGAGVCGGKDTLVVGSFTDLTAKDLEDARSRDLIGQLGGVLSDRQVHRGY